MAEAFQNLPDRRNPGLILKSNNAADSTDYHGFKILIREICVICGVFLALTGESAATLECESGLGCVWRGYSGVQWELQWQQFIYLM